MTNQIKRKLAINLDLDYKTLDKMFNDIGNRNISIEERILEILRDYYNV